MKILLDVRLQTLEGEDLRDRVIREDENGDPERDKQGNLLFNRPPITLRRLCEQTLINPTLDIDERTGREKPMKEDEMMELYSLLKEIHDAEDYVDLKSEKITMLKKMIRKKFPSSVLLVGRAYDLLDPPGEPKREDKKSKN